MPGSNSQCRLVLRAACLTAVSLATCLLSGCQSGLLPRGWGTAPDGSAKKSTPTETQSVAKKSPATKSMADPYQPLADDNWVLAIAAPDQTEPPRYRWRHHVLDDILASPRDKQPNWQVALQSEKPIVAANAAIALARLGEGEPEEALTAAVRSTELKLPVRRAAAEALGDVQSEAAVQSLRDLVDQYGQFTGEARSRYLPDLHAELIHALARQPQTATDARIAAGLKSPAPSVKREALDALALVPTEKAPPLPPLALDLSTDSDLQVRISALKLLVARQHPQAGDKVLRGLSDYELPVRLAAIELLGQIGGDEATAQLKRLANDSAEMIRVSAVQALVKRGDRDAVEARAGDKSWRVRRAVADSLAKYPDRRSINLAQQYLGDASLEVQREAVRSAAKWPAEKAGAVLFAAIESSSYQTRKDAATLLADCWPEAAGFPIDAPAPRRAELLAELQTKWNRQFGNIDQAAIAAASKPTTTKISPQQVEKVTALIDRLADRRADRADQAAAIESLVVLGDELPPLVDAVLAEENHPLPAQLYRDVLPKCGKEFELLRQMTDGDLPARRTAIAALAKQSEGKILPVVAVVHLKDLLLSETDPVMWLQAFKLIDHDPRKPAALLAAAGLSHPAAEIRRRACGYFATYPDPARTESLLAALSDENVSVLHAALQALAEAQPPADVGPVEKILAHADHSLHLEAAIVLVRWNHEAGRAALERMVSDDDPQLRRKTAQAIGKLGDPALTPTLIKLLDDQQDIRRAALVSLRSLVGSDPPGISASGVQPASYAAASDADGSSATLAEQAERWKQWYSRQNRQE